MEVIAWTRKDLESLFPEQKNLGQIVTAIEERAEDEGKVLCRITVNGMKFDESDENRFASTSLESVNELIVELEVTDKLVADTLVSLNQGLEAIRDRSVNLADAIRENPMGRAQVEFAGVMEQTNFLMEALGALKPRMVLSLESVESWAEAESKSSQMIKELLQAFERQDFILVSDVLEYEMYNLMEAWLNVIQKCEFR